MNYKPDVMELHQLTMPVLCDKLSAFFGYPGYSALSLPSSWKSLRHYETACTACERTLRIETEEMQRHVAASLEYDKRKKGGKRGRALKVAIPALRLEAGDMLEPGPLCGILPASRI